LFWLSAWFRLPKRQPSHFIFASPRGAQERAGTPQAARRAEGRKPDVKKSNQKKGDPSIALRFAQFPALLAGLGPARPSEAKAQPRSGRARTSMCSNIRAFPPSPAPLLGAMTGPKVKSRRNSNSNKSNTFVTIGILCDGD